MSAYIEDYGALNFTPKDAEIWKKIEKCGELSHHPRERRLGRCYNLYTCEKCGFSYRIDSSD